MNDDDGDLSSHCAVARILGSAQVTRVLCHLVSLISADRESGRKLVSKKSEPDHLAVIQHGILSKTGPAHLMKNLKRMRIVHIIGNMEGNKHGHVPLHICAKSCAISTSGPSIPSQYLALLASAERERESGLCASVRNKD